VRQLGLKIDLDHLTYYVGRETLIPSANVGGMWLCRIVCSPPFAQRDARERRSTGCRRTMWSNWVSRWKSRVYSSSGPPAVPICPNSDNPESPKPAFRIEAAAPADVPEILRLIRALAEYEKMSDEVVAIEADIRESMFGEHAVGEALLARVDGRAVGVAVFFRNFSTFLGRPGLYSKTCSSSLPAAGLASAVRY